MGNIDQFLSSPAFGVIGVSKKREKYGNKVLRCYLQHHKIIYPIHPIETNIEGVNCLKNIADLPEEVESLSMITPPSLTEKLMEQIIKIPHLKNIWMQPGAESLKAVELAQKNKLNIIYGGPCILVSLGYKD